ncbi:hypothetical protein ACFXTN_022756 [Malus domestica]
MQKKKSSIIKELLSYVDASILGFYNPTPQRSIPHFLFQIMRVWFGGCASRIFAMAKPKALRQTIDSYTVKPMNKTIRKKSTNKPCGARSIRRKGVDVQTNMVVIRILELLVCEDIKLDIEDVVVGVSIVGEVENTQVLRGACSA